jgi:hypothetical protein
MMIYEFGSIFLDSLDKLHWDIRQAIKNRDLDSLKRVIDNHNKLSECFLEFKSIFAPVIFSRFLLSSITFCVVGFHLIFVRFFKLAILRQINFLKSNFKIKLLGTSGR